MWLTGLVAPRHVGSSQTRARTRVPCIGRQILNHCATREAPATSFIWSDCVGPGLEKETEAVSKLKEKGGFDQLSMSPVDQDAEVPSLGYS